MTDPLVPADIDVDRLSGFMLDVDRMLSSELVAISSGDEFKAAFLLWCRAWKQKPAGSLPNDDKVLAAFSGAGKAWPKVRDVALRGWVLCSDGRLYHGVLCADVLRAADAKRRRRERTEAATAARQAQRNEQRDVERDVAPDASVTTSHRRDKDETRTLSSEANASGGEPPPGTLLDLKAELWKRAVPFLTSRGVRPGHERALVGKWIRALGGGSHGQSELLHVLASAQANCQGDVVEYVEAAIERGANGRANTGAGTGFDAAVAGARAAIAGGG